MRDTLYDRILLAIAQIAPVSLIFLSGWYASLDAWYVPLDTPESAFSEFRLAEKADEWLQSTGNRGISYYVFVDPQCACSKPTLKKLQSAIEQSDHPSANVVVIDIAGNLDSSLKSLVDEIPSIPMVISSFNSTLIYTGPANAGNFCTTAVDRVIPVIATSGVQPEPIHNWLSRGCYCKAHSFRAV